MTQEEKINYLRLALQMQDIGCSERLADQILETVNLLNKKKGKFSIMDAVEIKCTIERKYQPAVPDDLFDELENMIGVNE